jgi:hypothetical protein
MNCRQCQEKILESLAASAGLLPQEVAAHQDSCAACHEFCASQRTLFQSVDAALRSIANHPVPPSLLPGLRAYLDEHPVSPRATFPGWSLAVAALVLLVVGIVYSSRRSESRSNSWQSASIPSGGAAAVPEASVQPPRKSPSGLRSPKRKPTPLAKSSAETQEVMVLAEERRAFAKFVAEVPEETEVALALTHPAHAAADEPVEIALLQIDSLEVKPLEPAVGESLGH